MEKWHSPVICAFVDSDENVFLSDEYLNLAAKKTSSRADAKISDLVSDDQYSTFHRMSEVMQGDNEISYFIDEKYGDITVKLQFLLIPSKNFNGLKNSNGDKGFLVVLCNISQVEKIIPYSAFWVRSVLSDLTTPIYTVDKKENITWCNAPFEKYISVKQSKLTQKKWSKTLKIEKDKLEKNTPFNSKVHAVFSVSKKKTAPMGLIWGDINCHGEKIRVGLLYNLDASELSLENEKR